MPPVDRVAADANVILSAVLGHAALRVFTRSPVSVATTERTLDEVGEYLPRLAASHGLNAELLAAQFRLLGMTSYGPAAYAKRLPEARRLIGHRDPDDTDLLALALTLDVPIWSNDRDFESATVLCYTTAELLKHLGI